MKLYRITLVAAVMVAAMLLAACGTTRKVEGGGSVSTSSENAFVKKVLANAQTEKAVTAKLKARVQFGAKDVSLGGSLKMMRDDVIQLSLTFLGIEVGRMEFTKDNVLIIDRVNRQYARVPYSKVDFLQSASLDFHALQSLFWNEIFIPGVHDVATHTRSFSVSSSGEHTLLSLTSAPRLDYNFLTVTKTAFLDRTSIRSKNVSNTDNLECRYGNFAKLGGKFFPSTITVTFKGQKNVTLDLALSGLSNSEDWATRTEVSSRYSEMDVEKLLGKMVGN